MTRILEEDVIVKLIEAYSRDAVLHIIRDSLKDVRDSVAKGAEPPTVSSFVIEIEKRAKDRWRVWPERVINATGVILHTNLGRAPLSDDSVHAMQRVALGYSDLEFNLENGKRGSRQSYVSQLLTQITGAESAIVVNNNASAIMLGLAALASGKEVIVSRGEAVEIGGGFRIPDVLKQSGATLVEVGTTNRTYARDFDEAITENTGAILSVHASNFKVMGFTNTPTLEELREVGRIRGIPLLHDLGSGCLLDTTLFGLAPEPMPQQSVAAGVDLSFFSGDKLLGGPQSGIIVGTKNAINTVSSHPLARALRIDKVSMAGLVTTILHFVRQEATEKVPIWQMISESETELIRRAKVWAECIKDASVVPSKSAIGGGSLPGETLPSWIVKIPATSPASTQTLARRLRLNKTPVIARIEDDSVLLDPRTVLPHEVAEITQALQDLGDARSGCDRQK